MAAEAKSGSDVVDLRALVAWNESYCLNENSTKPMANLKMGDDRLVLESDADEEMLLNVAFMEPVKLHSVSIVGPAADAAEAAPKEVDLYVNKVALGFEDAEDLEPAQSIELTPEDLMPDSVTALNFVKFQNVTCVSLWIKANYGADTTQVSSLKFYGIPINATRQIDENFGKKEES
mmetsp:Transcript_45512/g.142550  ORF Transcript_45512/g.142550 Transcript_45512/m.142550 type:complete len:177 (-) Transcript_45512:121-651(-)|eukprot:CAMPEP_0118882948 /NCGR_PEP_ID=MMETSP1163-20130328/22094_1 /TAXON_ID=124430 /ORGANISM="Phaeomonas parva, Strain CCMP2877" /LENGTH=176 /DNA_ID=CAMNT_0006820187 /DNA_START=180 /DNA_END=710 /DNA_ORIENTATION=+